MLVSKVFIAAHCAAHAQFLNVFVQSSMASTLSICFLCTPVKFMMYMQISMHTMHPEWMSIACEYPSL